MIEFDDVSNFVSLRVVDLARALEKHSDLYLRSMAEIGVREWRAIVRIHRFDETRPIELSDALGIELGTMLGILAKLEQAGYLEMLSDTGVGYRLTNKGLDLFDILHPLMQNRQRRIVDVLEPKELEIFSQALESLRQRIDNLRAETTASGGPDLQGSPDSGR